MWCARSDHACNLWPHRGNASEEETAAAHRRPHRDDDRFFAVIREHRSERHEPAAIPGDTRLNRSRPRCNAMRTSEIDVVLNRLGELSIGGSGTCGRALSTSPKDAPPGHDADVRAPFGPKMENRT